MGSGAQHMCTFDKLQTEINIQNVFTIAICNFHFHGVQHIQADKRADLKHCPMSRKKKQLVCFNWNSSRIVTNETVNGDIAHTYIRGIFFSQDFHQSNSTSVLYDCYKLQRLIKWWGGGGEFGFYWPINYDICTNTCVTTKIPSLPCAMLIFNRHTKYSYQIQLTWSKKFQCNVTFLLISGS